MTLEILVYLKGSKLRRVALKNATLSWVAPSCAEWPWITPRCPELLQVAQGDPVMLNRSKLRMVTLSLRLVVLKCSWLCRVTPLCWIAPSCAWWPWVYAALCWITQNWFRPECAWEKKFAELKNAWMLFSAILALSCWIFNIFIGKLFKE